MPDPGVADPTDPAVRNARIEAIWIGSAWVLATLYCCFYSWWAGYSTPGRPLGQADVRAIGGVPSWAFWGYLVPWGVVAAFTVWFAGFRMVDDDLGEDHAADLERGIRDGAADD